MQFDFPTILFLAAVLTGLIWAADALFFAPRRRARAAESVAPGEPGEVGREATQATGGREQVKEPLLVEYSRSFFPIILIVLVLRSFVVEPFRIPSGSMMPTLVDGDFILVNKFTYGLRLPVINKKILNLGGPERGDVIVFRYPGDPSTDYIKRVIGLPGDRIEYHDKHVYVNGKPLGYKTDGTYEGTGTAVSMSGAQIVDETIGDKTHEILWDRLRYRPPYSCMENGVFVVPKGQYFVMGDNRDHSNDSRFWCGVPDENLVGKAFMIWMNWDSVEGHPKWSRIGDTIK